MRMLQLYAARHGEGLDFEIRSTLNESVWLHDKDAFKLIKDKITSFYKAQCLGQFLNRTGVINIHLINETCDSKHGE